MRHGHAVTLAVAVLLATAAVTPAGAATVLTEQGNESGAQRDGSVAAREGADEPWRIHNDVTVYRNGTARVVLTVNRSVDYLHLTKRNVHGLRFHDGADAVSEETRKVVWDTEQTRRLVYSVELGNARYGSAVLDSAVIFRTSEILSPFYWRAVPTPERRLHVAAPGEWSVAAPGERVAPNTYELQPAVSQRAFLREMIAVGNFDVHTWNAGEDTIRYAAFPSADAPPRSALRELLTSSMPVLEGLTGTDPTYPLLALTVPAEIENGGAARDHSFVVQGGSPTFNVSNGRSTYVHELVHLYQRNWGFDGGDWVAEGMASYYQHLVLYRAEFVSEQEFRHMVRVDTTTGWDRVGDPVQATATNEKYAKGEAVWAALDLAVRRATTGQQTVADVVAAINEQTEDGEHSYYVTRGEFLDAVRSVTGENFTAFYANFVESTAYPRILLGDGFDLSDPGTVDPGPLSRSALRDRIATLRDRVAALREQIAAQNETIAALRDRLATANTTVATLQDRLATKNATITDLRDRIDSLNATVERLRANESAGESRSGETGAVDGPTSTTDGTGGSGPLSAPVLLVAVGGAFAVGVRFGRRD